MCFGTNGSDEEKNKEYSTMLINLFLEEMNHSLKTSSFISKEEVFNKTIHKYGLFNVQFSEDILCMLQNYSDDIELLKKILAMKGL